MLIIGLNAYHGDASAAAVVDGRLVAAAEEERFTRIKHTAGFPAHALRYVVGAAGASPADVNLVVVARDPWARLPSKLWHALRMPVRASGRARVQQRFAGIGQACAQSLGVAREQLAVRRVEHHRAHLASAFLASPFERAACLSLDGLGDFASAMWGMGEGSAIRTRGSVRFPHSLGIFYTALTQYLGFPRYGDEYKVMGLASYGEPDRMSELRQLLHGPDNGRLDFALDLTAFTHHRGGGEMTWETGEPTIGRLYSDDLVRRLGPARPADAPIDDRHRAIAASLQRRLEEVLIELLRNLQAQTGLRRLCLAGGVGFNCVANGRICAETGFDEVYVQSAAGDAGLAIGAALHAWHAPGGRSRDFWMEHSYWGPEFSSDQIAAAIAARRSDLEKESCRERIVHDEGELCDATAQRIAAGCVVGWFQGRMEWGPRALGNRSILADPRRTDIRDLLNAKIKRREMFRPFAPSILEEATGEYFEQSHPSPFMLMAYRVRPEKRERIPATTHVDGTGRLQTVNERQNPRYHRLISAFARHTGIPVLLNTSFNENEPVVCTPEEALDCFLRTRMDVLVMGDHVLERTEESGP